MHEHQQKLSFEYITVKNYSDNAWDVLKPGTAFPLMSELLPPWVRLSSKVLSLKNAFLYACLVSEWYIIGPLNYFHYILLINSDLYKLLCLCIHSFLLYYYNLTCFFLMFIDL